MKDELARKLQYWGLIGPIGRRDNPNIKYDSRFFNMMDWYSNKLGYPSMSRTEVVDRLNSRKYKDLEEARDRIKLMRLLNNTDPNQPGMFDEWFHYTK